MEVQMDSLVFDISSVVCHIFLTVAEFSEDYHLEAFHDIVLHMEVSVTLSVGFLVHHVMPSVFDLIDNVYNEF